MRIAILTSQVPFVAGGAELHASGLEQALREAGHEAEIVSMPFKWYPAMTVLDHMLAARAIDVSEFSAVKVDLAIGLKFPAYLISHPDKVFWILHQHRQAYDLWDSGDSNLLEDDDGRLVREAIRAADDAALRQPGRVFANSANVAGRLKRYNGVEAPPLYHPPPLADRLREGDFGHYFFFPSRINKIKRQEFVLKSLALAGKDVRVVFAGIADTPAYGSELQDLADKLGVSDRVEWRGWVSDSELVDLYAGARGVLFTPVDEDLGHIQLEAMLSGKPVLTLTDAGEPAALIRHGVEGFVTRPRPRDFAEAMDRLAQSKDLAQDLGRTALQSYRAMDISWPRVVSTLTAAAESPQSAARVRKRPARRVFAFDNPQNAAPQPKVMDWLEDRAEDKSPSLLHLTERYVFGNHVARRREHYEERWPLYRASLDALRRSGIGPRRILQLGAGPPYVTAAFWKEALPEAELTVIGDTPSGGRRRHRVSGRLWSGFEIDVVGLNVETASWPFQEGEFDLVLGIETLERLAIDPGFVFREALRVLRDGGAFLVATPNIVSAGAVSRAIEGRSPYSSGGFVPWNGPYGRHNREYTPAEIEALGRYAGFELALLETADVSRDDNAEPVDLRRMAERGPPLELRGQVIIFVGRKTAESSGGPAPSELFAVDPAILSGRIELHRLPEGEGHLSLRVVNTSPQAWAASGPGRVRLSVDRTDPNGVVEEDSLSFDLPSDLEPGSALEVPIRALAGAGGPGCWHEIGLYLDGAGPFRGAGRSRPAIIFADRLEALPQGFDAA